MTFPVQVGPTAITINRDDRFLVCQPDGRILGGVGRRLLHPRHPVHLRLRPADQRPPPGPPELRADPVLLGAVRVHQRSVPRRRRDGSTATRSAIRVDRTVVGRRPRGPRHRQLRPPPGPADDRGRDRVRLRRHLRRPLRRPRPARPGQHPLVPLPPRAPDRRTSTATFRRELIVAVDKADSPPQYANGRLVFVATIAPKGVWHTCLKWLPITSSDARRRPTTLPCNAVEPPLAGSGPRLPEVDDRDPERDRPAGMGAGRPRHGGAPPRGPDVRAWRLHPGRRRALVRDAVRPRHARSSRCRRSPATRSSPPGRSAASGRCRRRTTTPSATWSRARSPTRSATASSPSSGSCRTTPYYGTHDATSLYLIVLSYLYQWLGDDAVLGATCRTPRRRSRWIDRLRRPRPGRLPGVRDPLVPRLLQPGLEGRRRRDPGGRRDARRRCRSPLCELQGYVYDAKLRMADIYEILGRPADARRLRRAGARAVRAGQRAVLVGGGGDLLPRPRRQEAADPDPSPRTPATCSSPGSSRPSGRAAS